MDEDRQDHLNEKYKHDPRDLPEEIEEAEQCPEDVPQEIEPTKDGK